MTQAYGVLAVRPYGFLSRVKGDVREIAFVACTPVYTR